MLMNLIPTADSALVVTKSLEEVLRSAPKNVQKITIEVFKSSHTEDIQSKVSVGMESY